MTTSSLPQFPSAVCAAAVVISGFLCGCASSARFSVEAKSEPARAVDAGSYRLEAGPALRGAEPSGALASQVLRDVRTALSAHGLHEARAGVVPDVAIEVEFAQGQAVTKELTLAAPVFATPSAQPAGEATQRRAGGDAGTSPRLVGSREVTRTATIYPKHLRLTAWSAEARRNGRAAAPLWQVEVENADEENDSVRYARWMVAAAMDWVGRLTDEPVTVVLGPNDSRVTFIAAGERRSAAASVVAVSSSQPETDRSTDG